MPGTPAAVAASSRGRSTNTSRASASGRSSQNQQIRAQKSNTKGRKKKKALQGSSCLPFMFPFFLPRDPRCRVPGCRQPARKIKVSNGRTLQPGLCTKHVCQLWRKNKELCGNQRLPGEKYCADHTFCTYPGCRTDRKNKDPEHPFCWEHHACQSLKCKEPRIISPGGRFCLKHTCRFPSCTSGVDSRSALCSQHHCHEDACYKTVPGTAPWNNDPAVYKKDNYCETHQHCQRDNCQNSIFTVTKNAARKFCFDHFCDIDATCDQPRVGGPDAKACDKHTCRLYTYQPACFKPKANLAGMYCKDHECKEDTCTGQRHQTTEWCSQHLCLTAFTNRKTCNKQREGTPENRDYCQDHKLCTENGCTEYGAFVGNVKQDKCDNHLKPNCQVHACDKKAENPKQSPMFCDLHTCAFSQCATQVFGPPFLFCPLHKCGKPECLQPKAIMNNPSQGLASFALIGSGSGSGAGAMANFLMPVGMYCAHHKCEVVGCHGLAVSHSGGDGSGDAGGGIVSSSGEAGQFCDAHKCREQGCGFRIASSRSAYCVVHECTEKDCRRPAVPDNAGYCDMHPGDEFGGGGGGGGGGGVWGAAGQRKSLYPPLRW